MSSTRLDTPVTLVLARWARRLSYADIPASVLTMSRHLILDGLGVAIAATSDPLADGLRTWAATDAGSGSVTAMGMKRTLAPTDAAFVNGTLIHGLDFDDHGYGGHATACILPAILAVAEAEEVSGQRLLTAYVAGMEAFGRLALCSPVEKIHGFGFHPTPVFGLIGAAVAVGKVLELGELELAHTIALSASSGVGFTANFGTMGKPMHAGWTASGAVRAAQFALAGLRGNLQVLESEAGYGTAYMHDEVDWPGFVDRLAGNAYRLDFKPPSIKQYPCCGGNQRAIQNLLDIVQENGLRLEDVASVDVHVNPKLLKILRYTWPQSSYEAKFCLRFPLSVVLAAGVPTLEAWEQGWWERPDVLAANEKITIITDGTGEKNHVEVVVRTHDGRTIRRDNDVVKGTAELRMTEQEVSDKYLATIEHGVLDKQAALDLRAGVLGLDSSSQTFWQAWKRLGAER